MTVQESRVIGPFRCCRHALPVNKHLSRRLKIAFKLATSCRQNTDSVEIVVVRDQFWLLSDRFRFEESSLHAPELRVSFWQSPEAVFVCVGRSVGRQQFDERLCVWLFLARRGCALSCWPYQWCDIDTQRDSPLLSVCYLWSRWIEWCACLGVFAVIVLSARVPAAASESVEIDAGRFMAVAELPPARPD